MKKEIIATIVLFMSFSAQASQLNWIATCFAPLMEGEYIVYLSEDGKVAEVSYSHVETFPVTKIISGPVSSYEYVTATGTERIVIAVDGGHELQMWDKEKKVFKKANDLTCNN